MVEQAGHVFVGPERPAVRIVVVVLRQRARNEPAGSLGSEAREAQAPQERHRGHNLRAKALCEGEGAVGPGGED